MMNVAEVVAGIFKPAVNLIDELHTSQEEKAKIKNAHLELQLNAAMQFIEYEKQLLKSQADIVVSEAQGGSWLQKSWRPITMLTFLGLVVLDSLGLLPNKLAPEAWSLLQLGLGGYVVGRSVEKSMPAVKGMISRK